MQKMSLLALFFIFSPFCSFNCFTFTLDKIHFRWKYFHIFLQFIASVFNFNVYLWLLCNFVLTFTLTFTWYTTDTLLLLCFTVIVNYDFTFTIHCANFIILISLWLDFIFSLYTNYLLNEAIDLKSENLEQTILSTSIATVGPNPYSDNNLQKSNNLLIKPWSARMWLKAFERPVEWDLAVEV